MSRRISLICLLLALTLRPGYTQDLLKRVKTDYLAKDKEYDRLPIFGRNAMSLADYLFENLQYPESAVADAVEGEVLIEFTIATTGAVKDVKVLEGAREDLAQAVLETFMRMPWWKPAICNNAPAETKLLFLVAFNRRNDPYLTQYKANWLLSAGITSKAIKPEIKFLLEKDRRKHPLPKSLLI